MSFKDKLSSDVSVFLNTGEFAETVSYTPDGSSTQTVAALVVRENLDAAPEEHGRVLRNQAEVYISSLDIPEVNVGLDKVSFPPQPGESSVEWRVVEVLSKAGKLWRLLVQR